MPHGNQRPIRVLFINTRSALGADVAVHLMLIRHFDPARVQVTIATNSRAVDAAHTLEILRRVPDVRIVPMNLGYELAGRSGARKLLGAAGNAAALLWALTRLAALVPARRIDIIHSTDRPRDALVSTLLARLTGRKNVLHLHIKWYPELGRATRWALAKCDAVLAISRFVGRSLLEGGVPDEKIHVALNATDAVEFDPAQHPSGRFRARLGLTPDIPLVGIVARIMVWKGHVELVEAMAEVRERFPDARLVIVGKEDTLAADSPDSYTARVRQCIARLGLGDAVLWAGWHDDMPSVFADLDVVAVPSYEEPFGLVVTEALAMERAVVGFDSGALPEIIRDGVDGLLVPARNPCALAEAICRLLEDPALRRQLGRSGRQRVLEGFTPCRQAEEVGDIYGKIISREPV